MTIASVLIGLLIATIPACIWHFFTGGTFKHLLRLVAFSWVGFWLGQFFAIWRGWIFLKFGPIYLGTALLFSIIFVIGGSWLFSIQPGRNE